MINLIDKDGHLPLVLTLLLLAYLTLMWGNGVVSLTHPDEVFYTQTAKEMLSHHNWLTPMIFDAPHFEKPILFFWLLMASVKLFGNTPFAARFFPALFGMMGVLLTYGLAYRMFRDKVQAFLSAVILCTSFIYLTLSRAVLTDMVFSILVVAALTLFYMAFTATDPRQENLCIIGGFIFSALAVLTKGILGAVFPLGAIVLYSIYRREGFLLRTKATLLGIILFGLIVVPWHLLMIQWYGQQFIQEYWNNVHVRRIVEAEHPTSNTWYFYLGTIVAGVMPWGVFLPQAFYSLWQQLRNRSPEKDPFVFLLMWILFIWAVMQTAQSKLASYIFPVFPAIAIVIGHYLNRVGLQQGNSSKPHGAYRLFSFMGVLLGLAAAGSIVAGEHFLTKNEMPPVYVFAILSAACGLVLFIFARQRRFALCLAANSLVTLIILIFLFLGHGSAEPLVSCREISQVLVRTDHSESTVLCSKFFVRGIRYYTDRKTAVIDINGEGFFSPHPIPFLNTDQKVLDFLSTQNPTYAVVKRSQFKDLTRLTSGRYEVEQMDHIGDKYLLKIEKLNGQAGALHG